MSALICGSVAYDNIMVFEDSFKNHILPDKIHILNVAFLVPKLRREFGGCATNIAYNLKLLGEEPLPMATVGQDYEPYRKRLKALGIKQTYIRQLDNTFTAQAFITTDLSSNQIIAFHPGAMNFSEKNKVARRQEREDRHGVARRPHRHDQARRAVQEEEDSVHLRSGPGHADVQRRRPAQVHRAGHLGHRQRLRVGALEGPHGLDGEGHHEPRRRADHHARRQGLRDPHEGQDTTRFRRRRRNRCKTRRVAATRIAPACSTAC